MVYRKTPATEARKSARRTTLLEAAIKMFGSYGYHAATVPMIVAEAGCSVGSFYAHFQNKEDIFAAVLETLGERVFEVMQKAEERCHPLEIRNSVESLFLYLAENPQEARILIVESSGLSPRLEQVRRSLLAHEIDQVKQDLEASPELVDVMDSTIAARCMVGAVFESITSWLEEDPANRKSAVEVARAVADYNLRAIRRVRSQS